MGASELEVSDELLAQLTSPDCLRFLTFSQRRELVVQIRSFLKRQIPLTGGHYASNLGVVELSLALHYAFSSPKDTILWDVGHQGYPHKIVTGRSPVFSSLRHMGGLSGFLSPLESIYDTVKTGHASTNLSLAMGLASAVRPQEDRRVVVVIGDGALTGGEALEALTWGGGQNLSSLIVIINDNEMSISPNVGGLSLYLSRLSVARFYRIFKSVFVRTLERLPFLGSVVHFFVTQFKNLAKYIFFHANFFHILGYRYVGIVDGHDLRELERTFVRARHLRRPLIIHVRTVKGRGDAEAEEKPVLYHSVGGPSKKATAENFTSVLAKEFVILAHRCSALTAVTPAMEEGSKLGEFHAQFPDRFFDVGIAEQSAVTFSAGLALGGKIPFVFIYSTFLQRAVDQIIHDVSLQSIPLVFIEDRAGVVAGDGITHQGIYDIKLFKGLEHSIIIAPGTQSQIGCALQIALSAQNDGLFALIRIPKATAFQPLSEQHLKQELSRKSGELVISPDKSEKRALLIALGPLVEEALAAQKKGAEEGLAIDVYALFFAWPLPVVDIARCADTAHVVHFYEDGFADGGVGETLALHFLEMQSHSPFRAYGVRPPLAGAGTRAELLSFYGLDSKAMLSKIKPEL